MIVCKLTDKDMKTYGGTQWEIGEWRKASGEGPLCSKGWLHWYSSPLLAAFHHPLHVAYVPPIRAWEAEADGSIKIEPMKGGSSRLRLLKEIELPEVSLAVRVRYAIYCAKAVLSPATLPSWHEWADAWLQGKRGKEEAARAAEAEAAAEAAEAAEAEAEAAWAAARAAWAAAAAAEAEAEAAWAAAEAAEAAEAAARAAWAAAEAAEAEARAADVNSSLDLQALAERAIKDEEEFQQNRKAPR